MTTPPQPQAVLEAARDSRVVRGRCRRRGSVLAPGPRRRLPQVAILRRWQLVGSTTTTKGSGCSRRHRRRSRHRHVRGHRPALSCSSAVRTTFSHPTPPGRYSGGCRTCRPARTMAHPPERALAGDQPGTALYFRRSKHRVCEGGGGPVRGRSGGADAQAARRTPGALPGRDDRPGGRPPHQQLRPPTSGDRGVRRRCLRGPPGKGEAHARPGQRGSCRLAAGGHETVACLHYEVGTEPAVNDTMK